MHSGSVSRTSASTGSVKRTRTWRRANALAWSAPTRSPQNFGRSASLDYILSSGGTITDAVSSQKWPGEAKVHVSLVNWVKDGIDAGPVLLDGIEVSAIGADLRPSTPDLWRPVVLPANAGRCFEGPSPKAKGFLLTETVARKLLVDPAADYHDVVRPYLTANDITDDPGQAATRWTIDFGLRTLEQAAKYPAALDLVRFLVKPERETNNRKAYRDKWWQFAEPRRGMRAALAPLARHAAMARHGKRAVLIWNDARTLASDSTDVFAFDDDFSMGVLQSRIHAVWAWQQGSTLKGDLRYTPTSVFMTFPWPDRAADAQRSLVGERSAALLARRSEICATDHLGSRRCTTRWTKAPTQT